MTGYLRPVNPTGICTYYTHCHRTIPSQEAGVDYYTPIGTPVRAAGTGVVFETGGGIEPATGRYLTIDLDDGGRVRYLHLSEWIAKPGQRVTRGMIVAKSGASGYGSEFFGASSLAFIPADTGGPHVHTTYWAGHYYRFGQFPYEPTLDFELYVEKDSTTGGGSTPFPTPTPAPAPNPDEEDDMAKLKGATYVRAADKATVFLLFNEESGFASEHTGTDGTYNNAIATAWETNLWVPITEAHANVIKGALAKVRQGA